MSNVSKDGSCAAHSQAKPRTHVVTLDPRTVATLGGEIQGPVRAITMGVETILSARKIILLATGISKAEALHRLRDHPMGEDWPCTFFREHGGLTVIADAPAASQL